MVAMRYIFDPKQRWLTVLFLLFVLSFSPLLIFDCARGEVDESLQKLPPASPIQKPLVIFYSRTGKTKMVANGLASTFSCTMEEIQSTEDREGLLGAFTCVLDQLLD